MSSLVAILIVCNAALPGWYMLRKCYSKQGIEFNHVLFFTFGFLYYWIIPVVVGIGEFFHGAPLMSLWYNLFDGIDDSKRVGYLLVCLGAYASFVLGTEICERYRSRRPKPSKKPFLQIQLMNGYLLIAAVLLYATGRQISGEFFQGYSNIMWVEDLYTRSVFGAAMVFSLSLWFVYTSMCHQKLKGSVATLGMFVNRFLALYAVGAFLAISMGARYIVISSIFMVAVYGSVYIRRWRPRAVGAFFAILVAGAVTIGLFRMSLTPTLYAEDLVFNALADSLNGALSLFYFLHQRSIEILRWPVFLLSDYLYLVPRIILPMKDSMLLSPEARDFHVVTPLGGMHSFFSFMINFGALGTMLFLFLFSFGLSLLKSRRDSILARAMYSMICGWLVISFFRNPFEVSLVKDIFQASIAIPAFVVGSVYFLSSAVRGKGPLSVKSHPMRTSGTVRPTIASLTREGTRAAPAEPSNT